MVTVTTTKEDLTATVHNGFAGIAINDNDQLFQIIKDYQEVGSTFRFWLVQLEFHSIFRGRFPWNAIIETVA